MTIEEYADRINEAARRRRIKIDDPVPPGEMDPGGLSRRDLRELYRILFVDAPPADTPRIVETLSPSLPPG